MAVAYESWRTKVQVEYPLKYSTTTACFIDNKTGEKKFCCRMLKKKEKKKEAVRCKCRDKRSGEDNGAVCTRFKLISDDCCKCLVALYEYIAEYFKCICALVCLQQPHTKFCCRLCNLMRTSATVWKNTCQMLRSVIDCILGME